MKLPVSSSSPLHPTKSTFLFIFLAIFVFYLVLYNPTFFYTAFSNYRFVSALPPPPAPANSTADRFPDHSAGSGDHLRSPASASVNSTTGGSVAEKLLPFAVGRLPEGCDVFSGRWVRDESTRPLYQESECPYIHSQLTCQKYGRPDRGYQQWRWQPHGCSLPVFNTRMMLEALRNKRMLFVGDSLNRGQFESMVCLVQSAIPQSDKSMNASYFSMSVFTIKNYNATIAFYWAPYLLESNCDNAVKHRIKEKKIRKSLDKHGKHWKDADILVFDTYLWWMTHPTIKVLKGSFGDKIQETQELSSKDAYRMAIKGMLKWVHKNVNPNKTRVFFTTMSPTHTMSSDWGRNERGNCYNETSIIEDPTYWPTSASKPIMQVIEQEFSKSKVAISVLNITQLSGYRKDAHASIYKEQWGEGTPEQISADPIHYSDCAHWCLPGLQDTWNELFFAKLFFP